MLNTKFRRVITFEEREFEGFREGYEGLEGITHVLFLKLGKRNIFVVSVLCCIIHIHITSFKISNK